MQANEDDIETVLLGEVFYRCYLNLENLKVIESWIYRGYLKFDDTTPDCDVAHYYYLFELHGGNPMTPYSIRLPTKKQFQNSMLRWNELVERIAEFEE